jgi:hypothetical protein
MGDDESVSRQDYVAKADEVCGTYQVRLSRIPRPVTADAAALGSYLGRALPIAREQLAELEKVTKPSDDDVRQQVNQFLALLAQELDLNGAAEKAADAGDRNALDSDLRQGTAVSAEAGRLAEQIGFVVCARPG